MSVKDGSKDIIAFVNDILNDVEKLWSDQSAITKKREFFDYARKRITDSVAVFEENEEIDQLLKVLEDNNRRNNYTPHESSYVPGEDALPGVETLKSEMSEVIQGCFDLQQGEVENTLLEIGSLVAKGEKDLLDNQERLNSDYRSDYGAQDLF